VTTTITIQTGGHAVKMDRTEGNGLTSPGSVEIPAHTTQTTYLWQGVSLSLAEVLEQPAADVSGVEATPSTLQAGDDLAASVQKPDAPRVELNVMAKKVKSVEYHRPDFAPHVTVAMLELQVGAGRPEKLRSRGWHALRL
jgi:hypothetical protein